MFVFKAAVVGAGAELAQAIAAAGIPVLLKGEGLDRARVISEKATAKLVEKGRLTEQAAAAEVERILGLITPTDSYDGFGDVDFVIEAVEDDLARKHEVFAELDAATPGHAILATSTSELSVTEIGEVTLRPDKVVGFHPAGPRIVEIVEGDDTSPETAQAAANFAQQIRRSPIRCADTEGFVAARIAAADDPFLEACLVLEEGVAGLRDIDAAAGGVFARADEQGLDTIELDEPPVILRRLIAQGRLGVKAGQGFYPYPLVAGDGPVQARAARRGRDRLARQPARELALAGRDRGARLGLGGDQGERRAGDGAGLGEPGAVLRGGGHQGLHEVGRRLRPGAPGAHPRALARVGAVARSRRSRPSTGSRSAAAARSRWPATSASRRARRPSASPRSTSGSSPASAARSGWRGSSARPRRWR